MIISLLLITNVLSDKNFVIVTNVLQGRWIVNNFFPPIAIFLKTG